VFERFRRVVETGEPLIEERLAYEDVDEHGVGIRGTWRAQVVRLADGFLSTSRDITAVLAAQEELAQARATRTAEREAVRLLQRLSIPTALPSLPGVRIAAHYGPADEEVPIGGDWYDTVVTSDGRLILIVGDVAGHGRAAAETMIRLRHVTNTFARTCPTRRA
jgi:serine phosphatase RsbU (regulator of sigma subunit)